MENFKVFYDEAEDILYFSKKGQEEKVVELAPGVNVEFDSSGKLIGVEIFKASNLFKDVIKSMGKNSLKSHRFSRMFKILCQLPFTFSI